MKTKLIRFNFWTDPCFDRIIDDSGLFERQIVDYDLPRDEIDRLLQDVRYLHVSAAKDEVPLHLQVTAEFLRRCPLLLGVSTSGAGYDTVDVDACTEAGVAVFNQAGGNANAVAELTFGLMLSVARRIVKSDTLIRTGRTGSREALMGFELAGRTLGLVGFGHIGRRTAALAQAFGMNVAAVDPYLDDAVFAQAGVTRMTFPELLASSDVVSLHCPRNQETMNMMDAAAFAAMRKGAWFISTARGGIHDETALHAALASGHLDGAGLDVWTKEPPPVSHPLLSLDNVVATFHTGGVTHEGRRNIAAIAARQLVAVAQGQKPERIVNDPAWPAVQRRMAAG